MTISAKTWARIAAIGLIALAVLVSAVNLRTNRRTPVALPVAVNPDPVGADPLVAELYHCQALGQGGASDPDCLRAWAENRRRFLAPDARPEASLAAPSMFPAARAADHGAQPGSGQP